MEFLRSKLADLNYCILHGWQGLPEQLPSDLDIVVAPEDLRKLEKAVLETDGARLVQLLQHESTCYYFVLAIPEGERVRFLPLDAATDYRRDGRVWFTARELLEGRSRWKDFWVAAPEVEFKYLLVKKILKADVPEHAAERLRELASTLDQRADAVAEGLLGREWGPKAVRWIRSGEWEAFRAHFRVLTAVLKRHQLRHDPLNPVRYWLPELSRIWRRWRYPTGVFVAVLGPDGAGKSTLIERLREELNGAFRRTEVFHLMPGLFRGRRGGGPVTDPHGKPPRSSFASLLKLVYYWLDYTLGYWFKVRPLLARSGLVLFDRYYDDLLVDPRRYRYGGPLASARHVRKLIPRPDLWLVLDVPEEEILRRKRELPIEEIRRQREGYRHLATELSDAVLLDGSLPPGEVVRQVRDVVLDLLQERYLRRRTLHGFNGNDRRETLAWAAQALNAEAASPGAQGATFLHLALPDGRGYLLPRNSRRAALRALSLYNPQRTKARLARDLLGVSFRTGLAQRILPRVDLELGGLRGFLEEVFSQRNLSLAVSLGTPGPHRKPVIQVLTDSGETLGYVKVGWNEQTKRLVLNEARSLQWLEQTNLTHIKTPKVIYWGWVDSLAILITEAIRFDNRTTPPYSLCMKALKEIGNQQVKTATLLESDFWKHTERSLTKLRDWVPYYQLVILKQALDLLREAIGTVELPWVWRLGDFVPWNIGLADGKEEVINIIDLEYARATWLPGWDVFHFLRSQEGFTGLREVYRWNNYFESLDVPKGLVPYLGLAYLIDLFLTWQASWFDAGLKLPAQEIRGFRVFINVIASHCSEVSA